MINTQNQKIEKLETLLHQLMNKKLKRPTIKSQS